MKLLPLKVPADPVRGGGRIRPAAEAGHEVPEAVDAPFARFREKVIQQPETVFIKIFPELLLILRDEFRPVDGDSAALIFRFPWDVHDPNHVVALPDAIGDDLIDFPSGGRPHRAHLHGGTAETDRGPRLLFESGLAIPVGDDSPFASGGYPVHLPGEIQRGAGSDRKKTGLKPPHESRFPLIPWEEFLHLVGDGFDSRGVAVEGSFLQQDLICAGKVQFQRGAGAVLRQEERNVDRGPDVGDAILFSERKPQQRRLHGTYFVLFRPGEETQVKYLVAGDFLRRNPQGHASAGDRQNSDLFCIRSETGGGGIAELLPVPAEERFDFPGTGNHRRVRHAVEFAHLPVVRRNIDPAGFEMLFVDILLIGDGGADSPIGFDGGESPSGQIRLPPSVDDEIDVALPVDLKGETPPRLKALPRGRQTVLALRKISG